MNFDGSSSTDDADVNGFIVRPPDTSGDVGDGHFVQLTTFVMQAWNTSGTPYFGPVATMDLFEEFGGQCGDGENFWSFEGLVRYDQQAGRWVIAYIPNNFLSGALPTHLCMAVSTSSDPAGTYNRYEFDLGITPDAPRLGVWPDGYYYTFNSFDPGTGAFTGVESIAFDRAAMIAGGEATSVSFNLADLGYPDMFSMVPADVDGSAAPPDGAPNHQATPGQVDWDGSPSPVLHMFEFHADFATPENSTLTGPTDVSVPDFNPNLCDFAFGCVPQSGGDGTLLNATPGSLMHGMQYRNFGDHEALVVSHTVNVAEEGDLAAVRWYEVRPSSPGAAGGTPAFTLFQSGTYSPSETNRFVPSIAMDVSGNIAMGYSVSDATIHPQIGVTGRLVGDPPGTMGSEAIMFAGGGSETGASFWGNFTSMTVDPADGCTFWYTNQYYPADGPFNWQTRIGTFKFASCTSGATGTLEGTVTDGTNPLQGVIVTAGGSDTTTDVAGHYSLTLPVGTYDVTATKYGYLPGSATGVEVTEDATTTQDFTLSLAPSALVNGTVRDVQAGWPLYARIQVSGPGYPGSTIWTDPVTGYYSVTLVEGITYTFLIEAVSPGYNPGGGEVPLGVPLADAPFLVKNWTLEANLLACNAPGYTASSSVAFSEDFSGGVVPPGWEVTNDSTGGEGGFPTEWVIEDGGEPCFNYDGNLTGGTGFFAVSDSDCPGSTVQMNTSLITPSVDLSSLSSVVLRFNEDYLALGDNADVDVSIDDGSSWTNVLAQSSNQRGPLQIEIDLTSLAAGEADVKVRFHNYNANWAWWWQVDDVTLAQAGCTAGEGGLVVGNVIDSSSGNGLNGATVTNIGGDSTTTFATPDPAQPDGFYILYAEAGPQDFEASLNHYQTDQGSVVVVPGGTQRLDFVLESGNLHASPDALHSRVNPGGTETQILEMTNTGTAPAHFEIREINAPPPTPTVADGPFADPQKIRQALARIPADYAKQMADKGRFSLADFGPLPGAPARRRTLAAGDIVANYEASFATPNGLPYGVLFDGSSGNFWISNLGSGFPGDNMDYQFLPDGTETGETIDMSSLGFLPVDGAFNSQSGMMWQATNDFFGGTITCIYEIDPNSQEMTGATICPDFGTPQTGLAYNPLTDTYYSGSFFDGVINHFDADGVILDSANIGLQISGLAFNPATGHLFVLSHTGGADIFVLDVNDDYSVFGSFDVGPSPGLDDFSTGGMEMDCDGRLILVEQLGAIPIYVVESGEGTDFCTFADTIPWVSEDPIEGTVPGIAGSAPQGGGGNVFPVSVIFDAGSMLPGLRQAQLGFVTDTPFQLPRVPLSITVRFLDVPDDNQFEAYIYGAAGAGIMFGGPPVCPAGVLYFCPDGNVTRADMAGYLWRAIMGAQTPPPVYQNIFTDVTFNDYNSFYIQGIYDLGVTAGCLDGTNYCPDVPVTRAQMSALVWRGEHGEEPPPSCSGIFTDVPCPSLFADYIEALFNEGVVVGCGGGNFCPHQPISNGQMAVFLAKAFNIPVVLPPPPPPVASPTKR